MDQIGCLALKNSRVKHHYSERVPRITHSPEFVGIHGRTASPASELTQTAETAPQTPAATPSTTATATAAVKIHQGRRPRSNTRLAGRRRHHRGARSSLQQGASTPPTRDARSEARRSGADQDPTAAAMEA